FECAPLDEEASTLARLAQADERVLGISREKHHRYLINDSRTRGFSLYDGADWLGYAYVDAGGHAGPVAVLQSSAMATAFRTALRLAAESGASQVSAFLPGSKRSGPLGGARVRHADQVSDASDVVARFRQLGPVSASQSGLHVTSCGETRSAEMSAAGPLRFSRRAIAN
ncbi:hypothetical protein IVB51_04065, partial [Bradyrhizobium sp. CW10]|nr:hypothetical protein [Bradyrhizobium sp. CW10]